MIARAITWYALLLFLNIAAATETHEATLGEVGRTDVAIGLQHDDKLNDEASGHLEGHLEGEEHDELEAEGHLEAEEHDELEVEGHSEASMAQAEDDNLEDEASMEEESRGKKGKKGKKGKGRGGRSQPPAQGSPTTAPSAQGYTCKEGGFCSGSSPRRNICDGTMKDCWEKGMKLCDADDKCTGVVAHAVSWTARNKGVQLCTGKRTAHKEWSARMKGEPCPTKAPTAAPTRAPPAPTKPPRLSPRLSPPVPQAGPPTKPPIDFGAAWVEAANCSSEIGGLGTTAQLDEFGYLMVAEICCNFQMEFFITRVIISMGYKVCDQSGIMGMVPWFSCGDFQSLEKMKASIRLGEPSKSECPFVQWNNEQCVALSPKCFPNKTDNKGYHRRRVCDQVGGYSGGGPEPQYVEITEKSQYATPAPAPG